MTDETALYTKLGQHRASELVDEYDEGFSEHALSTRGVALSDDQAPIWLFIVAWWDCSTVERLEGIDVSPEQSRAFGEALTLSVCEAVASHPHPLDHCREEGAVVETPYLVERNNEGNDSPEDAEAHLAYEMKRFLLVGEALTDAWNQGVSTSKSHTFAAAAGLKAMEVPIADTKEYRDVLEHTLLLLHKRTMGFVQLLRSETSIDSRPQRKKMTPSDVRGWISQRPSDKQFRSWQEGKTFPSLEWRAWSECMPTQQVVAYSATAEDDIPALLDACQKMMQIDTLSQVQDIIEDANRTPSEQTETEPEHQDTTRGLGNWTERLVPGHKESSLKNSAGLFP